MIVPALQSQKILWAVDAFPDSPEVQAEAAQAIKLLVDGIHGAVHPIFVYRPAPAGIFVQEDPFLDESLMDAVRMNLDELMKQVNIEPSAPPRVLTSPSMSVGTMVKTLIDYAEEGKFDLIIVGTHARKGMPRLFLGSFAERLILESPIPVLVVNAKTVVDSQSKIRHCVFPTDFSEESREVFEKVIAFVKSFNADVLLFHQLEYLVPQIPYPFVIPSVSRESLDEIQEQARKRGDAWVEWAERQGVRAKFHLAKAPGEIASLVVKTAKKLPSSVIAMASKSNRAKTVLLGSVTRKVIRSASCPVFVIHPKAEKSVTTEQDRYVS